MDSRREENREKYASFLTGINNTISFSPIEFTLFGFES